MKTKITLALILVLAQNSFAQESESFNQNASRSNHTRISLSAGSLSTQNDFLKNGSNIQADAFVPFYRHGSRFVLGIHIGGNYSSIKNSSVNNEAVADRYQVYNTTSTVSSNGNGSKSKSLSGLLGAQAMFGLGKFYISPLVSTGYSNFTLNGFKQTGTYAANGQSQDKDLVKREKQSSGGMIFKPQLKVGYDITPVLSVFASSAYLMGPDIKWTTQTWVPQGGFNQKNTYEPQQMQNGSWSESSGNEKYKAVEINIGVSLALGKRQHKPETIRSGAASASYAAGRLSMTPTTPKQSQGQNFGEKTTPVSQSSGSTISQGASLLGGAVGKNAAASALAHPGNPIGGIIVKGGKNPGGNTINVITDENGEVIFTAPEAGKYKLQFTAPEPSVKSNETGNPNAIVAGSPIGGIVVKGGKNPSPGNTWGAISTISDQKGTITFNLAEAGEYKLQITAPESYERSISEKGVKRH